MFYIKLAWANIKKNRNIYFPFLASMTFLVVLNLIMQVMLKNEGMRTLPDAFTVRTIFGFGSAVVLIFAVIFSFYTNSFLIKRRQKELGLYNILGMDKKSLGVMLLVENCISMLLVLIVGLVGGSIFSKLLFLILKKMTGFGEDFVFQLNLEMLLTVVGIFVLLFFLLLIYNILQLAKTNPIELLRGSEAGEKEPKSHWLLSLLGIVSLGAGYGIALSITDPVSAINLFFIAIVLVIIGTYLVAITASVTLLKFLRNRKGFYYRPKPFVNISGMIYRMKQNGAGLASICILSTMVLVTVSSTAGLFFGSEDIINHRFPTDINLSTQTIAPEDTADRMAAMAAENNVTINESYHYNEPEFPMMTQDNGVFSLADEDTFDYSNVGSFLFLTLDEYNEINDDHQTLADDEVLMLVASGEYDHENITIGDYRFTIKERLTSLPFLSESMDITDSFLVVLKDSTVTQQVYDSVAADDSELVYGTEILQNISGSEEARRNYASALSDYASELNATTPVEQLPRPSMYYASTTFVDTEREDNRSFTGGFLFIGIIFGLSFTAATALIIYYKQISEGYDDANRFEIMQKVGMSHKEVRKTILSQILMVFLFPIVLAVIHLVVALPLIKNILILFGLVNTDLINLVTIISVAIFVLCYLVVYWQTSKAYYRIVERKA